MTQWNCSVCTFENKPAAPVCEMCGLVRESGSPRAANASKPPPVATTAATTATTTTTPPISPPPSNNPVPIRDEMMEEEWQQTGGRGRGSHKNKGGEQQQAPAPAAAATNAGANNSKGGGGGQEGGGKPRAIKVTWTKPLTESELRDLYVEDAATEVVERKAIGADRREVMWSVKTTAHVHIGYLLKDNAARLKAIESRFNVRIHVNPKENDPENRRITLAGREEAVVLAKAELDKDLKNCRYRGPMDTGYFRSFTRRVREAERAAGIVPGVVPARGGAGGGGGPAPTMGNRSGGGEAPMTVPLGGMKGSVPLAAEAMRNASTVAAAVAAPQAPVAGGGAATPAVKRYNFEWGGENLFPRVAELWELQRQHHHDLSTHWKDEYTRMTWEMRKEKFEKADVILVGIVASTDVEKMFPDVAYVIATQTGTQGEIESVYVRQEYRGDKLGKVLCKAVINRLKEMGSSSLVLGVAEGNEDVIPFYEKLGFKTRWHYMKMNLQ